MMSSDALNNGLPGATPPRAFISHTTADDAFCHRLYDALLERGVRPIMDKRDFQPGDDLVKKIFDEGIGAADAVLFVLSPASVDRPWVREELSAGVVRKLSQATRLIPIVIDDLSDDRVPVALSATVWIRVGGTKTIEAAAAEIAHVLHADQQPNPTIAPPPKWTQLPVTSIAGLEAIDEVVLRFICEKRLEDPHPYVGIEDIVVFSQANGIDEGTLETVLAVLARNYVEPVYEGGSRLPIAVRPDTFAITTYLQRYRGKELDEAYRAVVAAIVNERAWDVATLVGTLSIPEPLVDHIITMLEIQGELKVARGMGGDTAFHAMPTLRRRLR